MNTTLTEVVSRAYDQERFLSNAELQAVFDYPHHAASCLQAAESLSSKAQNLSKGAADQIYQRFPRYSKSQYLQEKCIRDIEYFLRLITYCLVAGNTDPLDEYFLPGLEEVYRSLELSPACAIEALTYLKTHHGLTGNEGLETNSYLDYLISAFSQVSELPPISQPSQVLEWPHDLELDEETSMRGIVVLSHNQRIFSVGPVRFQSSQWQPQIIMSSRVLADDD